MKQFYQVPSIKVVAFKVEDGFTSPTLTNLNVGDETITETHTTATEGSEAFGFGSIFRN